MVRMIRNIPVRHLLQTTLFDANMMLINRVPAKQVYAFIVKRFRVLENTPPYLRVSWDGEGMMRNCSFGFSNPPEDPVFSPLLANEQKPHPLTPIFEDEVEFEEEVKEDG